MEVLEYNDFSELVSGENDFQRAKIAYIDGCVDYEILSKNKTLEYLDFLNLSKAIQICSEFFDVNVAVLVKNNIICSAALGSSDSIAFERALDGDPLSITNATVGFSKEITLPTAKLLKAVGVKNILATSFSKDAFSLLLDSKINLILIKTPLHEVAGFYPQDVKVTPFGVLIQEQNNSKLKKDTFSVVSKAKPTQQQVEDAVFAWKIAKHLQSNAAVIAKDLSTKAVIQGQVSSLLCCEAAMDAACENSKEAVLVVDGVIDEIEAINSVIQGRISLIAEAGNGKLSSQILKIADKYEISVIFTNICNYKY